MKHIKTPVIIMGWDEARRLCIADAMCRDVGRSRDLTEDAVTAINAYDKLVEERAMLVTACKTAHHVLEQLQDVQELFQESWNVNLARSAIQDALAAIEQEENDEQATD